MIKDILQNATEDIHKFNIKPIEIKNKIHERIWKDAEMIKKYPQ